jgi:acetone carboxylase gamma subunit
MKIKAEHYYRVNNVDLVDPIDHDLFIFEARKRADYLCACSCPMCCTNRNSKLTSTSEKLTRQEKLSYCSLQEQIQEQEINENCFK